MKRVMEGFILAVIASATLMSEPSSYAETTATVEQRLEELQRVVNQLQEVVSKQDQKLKEQEQLIQELRRQMCSPETAAELGPHLDKHLLHERSGVGEQLGNLRIAAGVTGIIQGSVGAENVSGEKRDHTDGSWSMELDLESPIGEYGLGFMKIEAGQGQGLTDELLLYQAVNDDALESESRMEVTEAWYQHSFVPERMALVAGKVDMTNYFDTNAVANDEKFQFLNSALVNSVAVEFPENGPGALLAITPSDWLRLELGWAKSDAQWEDIGNDAFGIAQLSLKPFLFQRAGDYRFYVWTNHSDEGELRLADARKNGWGAGISFDQLIAGSLIGFLRVGYEDEDVYRVVGAWSAGAEVRGGRWNRPLDVLGIAVSQALINHEVQPHDTETLLEVYYSMLFNQNLRISPDIQIVTNPAGNDENDTVVILGARAQLDF